MKIVAFGDDFMTNRQIKEWYKWVTDDRTFVDIDPRYWQPSRVKMKDNIERVGLSIIDDRRLAVRELEYDFEIAKFISKLLTDEQKNVHIEIAQVNLCGNYDENLLKVISGDES